MVFFTGNTRNHFGKKLCGVLNNLKTRKKRPEHWFFFGGTSWIGDDNTCCGTYFLWGHHPVTILLVVFALFLACFVALKARICVVFKINHFLGSPSFFCLVNHGSLVKLQKSGSPPIPVWGRGMIPHLAPDVTPSTKDTYFNTCYSPRRYGQRQLKK